MGNEWEAWAVCNVHRREQRGPTGDASWRWRDTKSRTRTWKTKLKCGWFVSPRASLAPGVVRRAVRCASAAWGLETPPVHQHVWAMRLLWPAQAYGLGPAQDSRRSPAGDEDATRYMWAAGVCQAQNEPNACSNPIFNQSKPRVFIGKWDTIFPKLDLLSDYKSFHLYEIIFYSYKKK